MHMKSKTSKKSKQASDEMIDAPCFALAPRVRAHTFHPATSLTGSGRSFEFDSTKTVQNPYHAHTATLLDPTNREIQKRSYQNGAAAGISWGSVLASVEGSLLTRRPIHHSPVDS